MANQLPSVTPLFFSERDLSLREKLTAYEVCIEVTKVVTRNHVDGAQNIRGTWRIHLKDDKSRVELLTKGLSIRGKYVHIFEQNPNVQQNPNHKVEKVMIRDLPFSVSMEEVEDYFKTHPHIKPTSPVKFGHIRDPDGSLTSFRNGDRFLYVESPVTPPLPVTTVIGDRPIRIHHMSQSLIKLCVVCNKNGHTAGSSQCEHFVDTNQSDILTHKHILNPAYSQTMRADGISFPSMEQAFLYTCTCRMALDVHSQDLADEIRLSRHAGMARTLCDPIPMVDRMEWYNRYGLDTMVFLLELKCDQSNQFMQSLLDSGHSDIAIPSRDNWWGTGLSIYASGHILSTNWPGLNVVGSAIMQVRLKIEAQYPQHQPSLEPQVQYKPEYTPENQAMVNQLWTIIGKASRKSINHTQGKKSFKRSRSVSGSKSRSRRQRKSSRSSVISHTVEEDESEYGTPEQSDNDLSTKPGTGQGPG